MSAVVETAVISFILPSAECDLGLNLLDKGILNAITYCGESILFLAPILLLHTESLLCKTWSLEMTGEGGSTDFVLYSVLSTSRVRKHYRH